MSVSTRQTSSRSPDMVTERVRYLFENLPTSLAVNLALGALMGWVLWDRVPRERLALWLLLLAFLSLVRALTYVRYNRSPIGPGQSARWRDIFMIQSTITGSLWGISVWLYQPFHGIEPPVFLAFARED